MKFSLDGAGPLRQLFSITVPMMTPLIFYNMVIAIIKMIFLMFFLHIGRCTFSECSPFFKRSFHPRFSKLMLYYNSARKS